MKVFIKAGMNGFPETETDYTAWQGFLELGYQPIFYANESELEDCRPDDLIVGGVSIINRRLKSYGITVPEYDYPDELKGFMGRRVWTDTLQGILAKPETWPVFVKPVRDKAFVGFVLRKETDVPRLRQTKQSEPVLCSELVHFKREWLVFVRYGNICDVRPYIGDWHCQYNPDVIEQAVSMYKTGPAGYAIDFGVTNSGQTLLVEVNDGFALGSYGVDPVQYAKLLSARWCELTSIHDECDLYFEKTDWQKRKEPAVISAFSAFQKDV